MKRGEHFMRLPILISHHIGVAESTNVCDMISARPCAGAKPVRGLSATRKPSFAGTWMNSRLSVEVASQAG
jgi:hypothetical protein